MAMGVDDLSGTKKAQVSVVLKSCRCLGFVFLPVSFALVHVSLDTDGDPLEHVLSVLVEVSLTALAVQSFVGAVPVGEEAAGYVALLVNAICVQTSYVMLSPCSTAANIASNVNTVPMFCSMTHLLVVYFNIELGADRFGSRNMQVVHIVTIGAWGFRFWWDAGARHIIRSAVLPLVLMPILGHMMECAKAELLRARTNTQNEARRAEEALRSLQAAKVQVEMVSQGSSRMLTALCDVMIRLDSALCILEPSGQLGELLMPGCSDAVSQLAGHSFLSFMASIDDGDRARETLQRSPCQGAAGAFNVLLQDADGAFYNTEVFYVRLGSEDQPLSYLLGLRLRRADTVTLMEPEAPEASVKVELRPAHSQQFLFPDDAARAEATHQSRVGVLFDAGSRHMDIIGHDPFGRSKKHAMRPERLLSRVSSDQAMDFEEWVVQIVQDAPWDQTSTSELFPGSLTLQLPRVGRRWLRGAKVWLETSPPDGDRLPTTLWMEGLEVHGFGDHELSMLAPLAPVQERGFEECEENDDSSDSEIWARDSVSIRCRSEFSCHGGDASAGMQMQMHQPADETVDELVQHGRLEEQLRDSSLQTVMRFSVPPVMMFSL
mmetsp:Transcript_179323/g.568991  ORF Transcript_179323/g.568991 Transcript_179323/m.568991 type:complete len:604 (+) Transcript_179323:66-1877(+)